MKVHELRKRLEGLDGTLEVRMLQRDTNGAATHTSGIREAAVRHVGRFGQHRRAYAAKADGAQRQPNDAVVLD